MSFTPLTPSAQLAFRRDQISAFLLSGAPRPGDGADLGCPGRPVCPGALWKNRRMAHDVTQPEPTLPPWRRTTQDGAPYWTKNYQPGVPIDIELPTESLCSLLDTAVREAGNHVATQFFGAEMTYRELGDRVARAAEGLRRLGVHAGDRVAILLPNCPQHLIAFYAIVRLGAVVVEHNPLYTAPELEKLFADHGARVAIALDASIDKLNQLPIYERPT